MHSFIDRIRSARLSVGARLGLIQILVLVAMSLISLVAWHATQNERSSGQILAILSSAERTHQDADAMHDKLLANANAALLLKTEDSLAAGEVLASLRENSGRFETDLQTLQGLHLPDDLARSFGAIRPAAQAYIALANSVVTAAIRDHAQAVALEPALNKKFEEIDAINDRMTALMASRVERAERDTIQAAATEKALITVVSFVTVLLAWSFVAFVTRSIRHSLRQVGDAARALAAGNLSVRSEIGGHDEVGELAGAVNKMADDLQTMIGRLLAEADRDAFSTQLNQALEMAETETNVSEVASRAMAQIAGNMPMELLLSDAQRSDLRRAAQSPTAGAPACGVESLASCVAIRRGTSMVFDDSEALEACPRLSHRSCGPVSAVCVPVSFMGRSFGVLHASAPVRKTPTVQQQAQLGVLGVQAGARIGTLRAFERTRLHAYTDGLTGLSNRRALEQVIHDLAPRGLAYAFALLDLDRFKVLNDTHGHEAGDRALRSFAEVLRKSIRRGDHVGRWGGEEFAVLFPAATARQALEVVERIRADLAEMLVTSGGMPFTASIGIADSTMATSFEEILRLADEALYRSKDGGRDRATIGIAVVNRATPSQEVSVEDQESAIRRSVS